MATTDSAVFAEIAALERMLRAERAIHLETRQRLSVAAAQLQSMKRAQLAQAPSPASASVKLFCTVRADSDTAQQLRAARDAATTASEAAAEAKASNTVLFGELAHLESEVAQAVVAGAAAKTQLERARTSETMVNDELAALRRSLAEASADAERSRLRESEMGEDLAVAQKQLRTLDTADELRELHAQLQQQESEASAARAELQAREREMNKALATARTERERLAGEEMPALRAQLQQREAEVAATRADLRAREAELSAACTALADAELGVDGLQSAASAAEHGAAKRLSDMRKARESAAEAAAEAEEHRAEAATQRGEASRLKQREMELEERVRSVQRALEEAEHALALKEREHLQMAKALHAKDEEASSAAHALASTESMLTRAEAELTRLVERPRRASEGGGTELALSDATSAPMEVAKSGPAVEGVSSKDEPMDTGDARANGEPLTEVHASCDGTSDAKAVFSVALDSTDTGSDSFSTLPLGSTLGSTLSSEVGTRVAPTPFTNVRRLSALTSTGTPRGEPTDGFNAQTPSEAAFSEVGTSVAPTVAAGSHPPPKPPPHPLARLFLESQGLGSSSAANSVREDSEAAMKPAAPEGEFGPSAPNQSIADRVRSFEGSMGVQKGDARATAPDATPEGARGNKGHAESAGHNVMGGKPPSFMSLSEQITARSQQLRERRTATEEATHPDPSAAEQAGSADGPSDTPSIRALASRGGEYEETYASPTSAEPAAAATSLVLPQAGDAQLQPLSEITARAQQLAGGSHLLPTLPLSEVTARAEQLAGGAAASARARAAKLERAAAAREAATKAVQARTGSVKEASKAQQDGVGPASDSMGSAADGLEGTAEVGLVDCTVVTPEGTQRRKSRPRARPLSEVDAERIASEGKHRNVALVMVGTPPASDEIEIDEKGAKPHASAQVTPQAVSKGGKRAKAPIALDGDDVNAAGGASSSAKKRGVGSLLMGRKRRDKSPIRRNPLSSLAAHSATIRSLSALSQLGGGGGSSPSTASINSARGLGSARGPDSARGLADMHSEKMHLSQPLPPRSERSVATSGKSGLTTGRSGFDSGRTAVSTPTMNRELRGVAGTVAKKGGIMAAVTPSRARHDKAHKLFRL